MKAFKLRSLACFAKRQLAYTQSGAGAMVVILLVLVIVGFATVAGIYFSRYTVLQRQYDAQLAEEIADARAEQKAEDEARFTEIQKEPFRAYSAPPILGDITIRFPKSWSLYALEDEEGGTPLDLTMHPDAVKLSKNTQEPQALRVVLRRQLYSEVLGNYDSAVNGGALKASAVRVSGTLGTRLSGEIVEGKQGAMVILPLRDKTLSIWTESEKFVDDFNKVIQRSQVTP